ncbi:MAG: RidA family protein [Oscillospiraceae bacterium]
MDIKRFGGNGRRSLCVKNGGVLYVSGITASDLSGDIKRQTTEVLDEIENILERRKTDKNNLLSVTVYLADMADYGAFNSVWDEWVIDSFEPCRSVVEAKLATEEYKVKISAIAAV